MVNNGVIDKKTLSSCCISHHFYNSASKNPTKIAVIHARGGGAKIAREFRKIYDDDYNNNSQASISGSSSGTDELFDEFVAAKSMYTNNPPMFEGDECFTFSQVLEAVDSLSSRIRTILDGGDDLNLVKPTSETGSFHSVQSVHDHASESSKSLTPGVGLRTEDQNVYTPRIVGIYMVPSVEYIISVLSVLRCGEAFMPLDPSWPKERILSIVSSSKAVLIIGRQSSTDGNCQQLDGSNWFVDCSSCSVLFISVKENLMERFVSSHLEWPCERGSSRLFCYLMYTSGSTGKPKGVCGTETGLLNRFLWMQGLYPLHGEELLLFKTSVSFIDHLQEFLGPLLTSCTLVIPPSDELKENLLSVVDYLQAYSINRLVAVPSLMRAILPALKSPCNIRIQSSLELLVLSGEVLPLSLWDILSKLLPKTAIMNLYGSTEVSGDCTYFDCKRLPLILETEALSSVPIGFPIANCDVILLGGEDVPNCGEIYVGGLCVAKGYISYPSIMPLDYANLCQNSSFGCPKSERGTSQHYFKTGDFARQLQSGDLVFIGRKDRTIKVNGQRIALEEIEGTLRVHKDVIDAVVVSSEGKGEGTVLEAYLVTTQKDDIDETLGSSIRRWLVDKIPLAMIPNCLYFMKSFPLSSTGKVDYKFLACSRSSLTEGGNEDEGIPDNELLQVIKKAFCDALMVEKISSEDDFFALGGDSISAAHASHNLGINMRLLYTFPTPIKLQMALLEEESSFNHDRKLGRRLSGNLSSMSADSRPVKYLKLDSCVNSKGGNISGSFPWNFSLVNVPSSFSRANKAVRKVGYEGNNFHLGTRSQKIPRDEMGSMRELWKVHMESCVDASPLVVFREEDIYLYIGSHSHKFLCINANSGSVQWEIKLEGRVECSAAILGDFSQVIVGCYKGNIYFLDSLNGSICWTFQTCGEVKSQPVVDNCRHLVWCGSYDHNLYALDYRSNCCIYKLHCGGSIYGSPMIDEVHEKLYVASTCGHVTAICLKASPFSKMWVQNLGAPVFGSLSINSCNGNVICCLVNGHVLALDTSGSIIWRGITGGPIFAAPCISHTLPSQVVICSRDGSIYSFELEKGDLLWKHNVGDPITAAAYVDENLHLLSDLSHLPDRLLCVCASSGTIYLLRINSENVKEANLLREDLVQEFARLDLKGDIFSSPVMIGGRVFIGCRDDYVHCIQLEDHISVQTRTLG